jgi:hypothetical protein
MIIPSGNLRQIPSTKLQVLQNRILRTIGKFPRNTPIRNIGMAFQIPYVYDYITKLCRQHAQVTQLMKMHVFAILCKVKPNTDNTYKRLELGGGQAYDRSSDWTAVVVGATFDRA